MPDHDRGMHASTVQHRSNLLRQRAMRDGTCALTGPWTCNEPSLPGAMRVSADEELHRAKAQGRDRIVADE
jgi:hypothetical protein